jgi:hypothetical protein
MCASTPLPSPRRSSRGAHRIPPPLRRYTISFLFAAIVASAASFSISTPAVPARTAAATTRVPAVLAAYNPKPSKARPKKSKQPKEKVKAAPSAAIEVEQTFFEGPPSITETLIPGLSVFTVVGIIPFSASLARQAWTRYKLTNRRIEVASGFQGKDVVQVLWREITDVKWLRRYGGAAGDVVFTLQDGSKLEVRSVPEFDRNLAFIMSNVDEDVAEDSFYPDQAAQEYKAKVDAGELPPPTLASVAETAKEE